MALIHRWQLTENANDTADGTVSLLHFDNNLTDESGKVWTAYGGATTSNAQSKFGGYSGYFDGVDDYLSTSYSSDFDFSTGDWTIDFWQYATQASAGSYYPIQFINCNNNSGNFRSIALQRNSGKYTAYIGSADGSAWAISNSNIASELLNQWVHIALMKSGNSILFALNGTIYNLGTISGNIYNPSYGIKIGFWYDTSQHYEKGYIDELRISKGIARWTSNFTPPTAPYSPESFGPKLNLTNNGGVTFSADGALFNASTKWLSCALPTRTVGTWSVWIKPSTYSQNGNIISRANNIGGYWQTLGVRNNGIVRVGYYPTSLDTTVNYFSSTYIPLTSHTLLTFTFDGSVLKCYVGSQLAGQASYTPGTITTDFAIGTYGAYNYDSPNWNFQGSIKDFREYDYVLSASEISALYAAGPNPSEAGTLIRLAQVF